MLNFQAHLIFPTHAVAAAGPMPLGAEELSLTVSGDRLAGIYIPADKRVADRMLILGFGGNAWNAQDVAEYLHELYPEAEIVAFHYRGYKPSGGQASAKALIGDAPLIYDLAVEKVRPKKTIVVGFSIGSGIATNLAAQRPVKGAILVTPFDSLKAVAQSMYPWLPIAPFFEHEIDSAAVASRLKIPVAVVAAGRDEIVPADRTNALRKIIPNLVFDRTIARGGHNDIYARSDFQEAMRDALAAVSG